MSHTTPAGRSLDEAEPRSKRGDLRKSKPAALRALALGALLASCGAVDGNSTSSGGTSSTGEPHSGGADSGGQPTTGGANSAHSGGQTSAGGANSGGQPTTGGANSAHSGGQTSPGGGGAGGAGAGAGGEGAGGEGGWRDFDPACRCVLDDFWFECSLPIELFAQRLPEPSSCAQDLDYLWRSDCADGTTQHLWSEGTENDYSLVRDEQGNPIYGYATGYVGSLCGIEPGKYDVGTIEAGTKPASSSCETCQVCTNVGAGGDSGVPAACP